MLFRSLLNQIALSFFISHLLTPMAETRTMPSAVNMAGSGLVRELSGAGSTLSVPDAFNHLTSPQFTLKIRTLVQDIKSLTSG